MTLKQKRSQRKSQMTTLAYCNKTKLLAADTRMVFTNYAVSVNKIVFHKKAIVLSAAGNAGEGEWLRWKLQNIQSIHELYKLEPDEKPKLSDTFSAFVWWRGPWFINDDCFPVPIEGDFWCDGTGGDYALAFLRSGYPIHDAVLK